MGLTAQAFSLKIQLWNFTIHVQLPSFHLQTIPYYFEYYVHVILNFQVGHIEMKWEDSLGPLIEFGKKEIKVRILPDAKIHNDGKGQQIGNLNI